MTERPALAVGLMSGTSLDGMDAALVRLNGPTSADLVGFESVAYSPEERARLERAITTPAAPASSPCCGAIGEWG
ncbi:MAG: anhydro-N-acetylmuramic acid kinase [Gemmatimonadales bacterium]